MISRSLLIGLALVGLVGCDSSTSTSTTDAATSAPATASAPAAPAKPANPYAGKNVTYIVTTNAGGGYDAYARLIGKYLAKYLGAENVLIENIPGAGHIVGTNTLWKAKPDGLTIGTFNAGLIYNQILARDTMQFDLKQFTWIGKAAGEPRSIVVSKSCPVQSMQDLLNSKETIKFSSAGIGSASYTETKLLAEALKLPLEVLPGFDGTEGEMSMMRGEVCGQFGSTSSLQPFVNAGEGHFILTVGGTIEGVPNVWEFVKDGDDHAKGIISLVEALAKLGRVTAAPPGLPKELYDQLLAAYKSSLTDPAFLAEAEKLGYPIETGYGEDVHTLVVNALNQSPATVELLSQTMKIEEE